MRNQIEWENKYLQGDCMGMRFIFNKFTKGENTKPIVLHVLRVNFLNVTRITSILFLK